MLLFLAEELTDATPPSRAEQAWPYHQRALCTTLHNMLQKLNIYIIIIIIYLFLHSFNQLYLCSHLIISIMRKFICLPFLTVCHL